MLYSVATWDMEKEAYTPQRGLSVPSFNITLAQLRQAIRELKELGYTAHRRRCRDGSYYDNDTSVIIERTNGKPWREIMKDWRR